MSILIQIITVAIFAASLIALLDIAYSLRVLRDSYVARRQAIRTVPYTSVWDDPLPVGGEAIWIFKSGKWTLSDKSGCRPGFEPGPPPSFKGEFEGHSVRQACRRRG